MQRRDFILTSTAGALSAALAPAWAQAQSHSHIGKPYKPGLVSKHLAAGDTVFLDFYTDWCSTCAAQGRIITGLLQENPAYEDNVVFIRVDWDIHRSSKLSRRLNIPRRSTLVALKGDEEIGRIVAGTSTSKIKALMDAALGAATA